MNCNKYIVTSIEKKTNASPKLLAYKNFVLEYLCVVCMRPLVNCDSITIFEKSNQFINMPMNWDLSHTGLKTPVDRSATLVDAKAAWVYTSQHELTWVGMIYYNCNTSQHKLENVKVIHNQLCNNLQAKVFPCQVASNVALLSQRLWIWCT